MTLASIYPPAPNCGPACTPSSAAARHVAFSSSWSGGDALRRRWRREGDGAALVTGRMTAKVSVAGTIVHVDNRYLVVWARERGAWKFVAYQPTPIIHR